MKSHIKPVVSVIEIESTQMICLSFHIAGKKEDDFQGQTTEETQENVEKDPDFFAKQYTPFYDDNMDW